MISPNKKIAVAHVDNFSFLLESITWFTNLNAFAVTVKTNDKEKLFLTRLTHFYQCNSSDTHPLYRLTDGKVTEENRVNMTTSNLVVKPYKSLKSKLRNFFDYFFCCDKSIALQS